MDEELGNDTLSQLSSIGKLSEERPALPHTEPRPHSFLIHSLLTITALSHLHSKNKEQVQRELSEGYVEPHKCLVKRHQQGPLALNYTVTILTPRK